MKIAALDFETCNNAPGSICSVGLVTYTDGQLTGEFSSLIHPHPIIYADRWMHEHVHGIRRSDVANSPELPEIYNDMEEYLSAADLVVCHWATFDIQQLRAALRIHQLPLPSFDYACTCLIARKVLPDLPNHKLNTLADHFGFDFKHHDALDDARAAAFIMNKMLAGESFPEFRDKHGIAVKKFS